MLDPLSRRSFLRLLGLGAATATMPSIVQAAELVVPERRIWQVPRSAPFGRRVSYTNAGYDECETLTGQQLADAMAIERDLLAQPAKHCVIGQVVDVVSPNRVWVRIGEMETTVPTFADALKIGAKQGVTAFVIAPGHYEL